MKFKGLKPGDKVFVVYQRPTTTGEPRREVVTVHSVGRKYASWMTDNYYECKFYLQDGQSYHPGSCNDRANHYGWDVYWSREEWEQATQATTERRRLRERLIPHYELCPLSPAAVCKIHEILDQEGVV